MKLFSRILLTCLLITTAAHAQSTPQKTLSDMEIQGMAANPYDSGELPLGDRHFVTDQPRKGYIYLCHAPNDRDGKVEGGAQANGPWIHSTSWNLLSKPFVQGDVMWGNAQFTDIFKDQNHMMIGNGLPINHGTGIFPVQSSDPAFQFDRNPNVIAEHAVNMLLPRDPTYSDVPHCMGMEVGVMLSGVPIFNGFDAGLRDAAAHEVQDKCSGHPQRDGQYHYHSLSACMKDISEKTILGYALDGFPITGPLVAQGRYLTTKDLDDCHGITSEIISNGQPKITYHYVMTQDFPYSVSCFRAHPIGLRVSDISQRGQNNNQAPANIIPDNSMNPNDGANMQNNSGVRVIRGTGNSNGMSPQQPPVNGNGMNDVNGMDSMNAMPMNGQQNGPQVAGPQGIPQGGPPPEALAACTGHANGSPCNFHSPRGPVSGNCQFPPGKPLACAPGWNAE